METFYSKTDCACHCDLITLASVIIWGPDTFCMNEKTHRQKIEFNFYSFSLSFDRHCAKDKTSN